MVTGAIGGETVEIIVNNKAITIPQDFKIIDLLEYLKFTKSVAIFVNGKQLLQAEYYDILLNNNDKVRIIKPLGGG